MPPPKAVLPSLQDLQEWVAEANSAVGDSLNFAGKRIKLCVRIGQALADWKKQVGHGHWLTWLNTHFSEVTYETARKWIKLGAEERAGRLGLDTAKSVRQAYLLTGILPENPGGSSVHGEKPISYVVHADRLQSVLREMDVKQLTREEMEQLRGRLWPIVEFYHALVDA